MKEKIINIIKDAFTLDERVIFAYAYGSFSREESFRDVDIAIYVKNPQENPFVIISDIKAALSRLAKKENLNLIADQFDVQIINDAPFTFLKRIFKEGIILLDHDADLRTDIVKYVSLKYRECAGLLAEASQL
jgi:predicted nucleotidyltransferase